MYDIYEVLLLLMATGVAGYWWRISGQKALALQLARNYCERHDLQLLDQTLAFSRYRLTRDSRGKTYLCRLYEFDFCTDGADRRRGTIVLAGYSVLRIVTEAVHSEVVEYQEYPPDIQ